MLDKETDSVYIFPMCRDDFEKVRIVGLGLIESWLRHELLRR